MLAFDFENQFVSELKCIPMTVRYKLDLCGIKLKLKEWLKLTEKERQHFFILPCDDTVQIKAFASALNEEIRKSSGEYPSQFIAEIRPEWNDRENIPQQIQDKMQEKLKRPLTIESWQSLDSLKRFALHKLSRPSHEGNNFVPALKEFKLV
jgi:hypothetical protein